MNAHSELLGDTLSRMPYYMSYRHTAFVVISKEHGHMANRLWYMYVLEKKLGSENFNIRLLENVYGIVYKKKKKRKVKYMLLYQQFPF